MDHLFYDLTGSFINDWYGPFNRQRIQPWDFVFKEDEPFFRTPLSNIREEDTHFSISAELPGIDKGDIKITIQDGMLEMMGEYEEENEEDQEEGLIRREYQSSRYYRCFHLPENINEDEIDANLDNGILKVSIPKVEPLKKEKKKIAVK